MHRRLLKLERNRPPSTDSKIEKVQEAALAATSLTDLRLIKDLELLKLGGREQDATEEQKQAQNRFDAAYEIALIASFADSGDVDGQFRRDVNKIGAQRRL